MTDPYNQLVSILDDRMNQITKNAMSWLSAELGTITASGLKLDSFKHEIRDYLVAEWLVRMELPQFGLQGTQSGLKDSQGGSVTGTASFSFQPAIVENVQLKLKSQFQPGDRVLALPLNGGQDLIVICKVVS